MASVCQVYDETNGVVLFDLNDPTAANAGDNLYSSTELLSRRGPRLAGARVQPVHLAGH